MKNDMDLCNHNCDWIYYAHRCVSILHQLSVVGTHCTLFRVGR